MKSKKTFGSIATDPAQVLQRIQVLIIDGSPRLTDLYRNIFVQLGFSNVFTANNSSEGVQVLKEMRIDLVVSDWELKLNTEKASEASAEVMFEGKRPAEGGIRFVETLRRSPASPNPFIPVIMLTEGVTGEEVMAAVNAGVNEIIVKPFKAEHLCDRMVKVIDNPRIFITAQTYKGPCRRRKALPITEVGSERRVREVRVVKHTQKRA